MVITLTSDWSENYSCIKILNEEKRVVLFCNYLTIKIGKQQSRKKIKNTHQHFNANIGTAFHQQAWQCPQVKMI